MKLHRFMTVVLLLSSTALILSLLPAAALFAQDAEQAGEPTQFPVQHSAYLPLIISNREPDSVTLSAQPSTIFASVAQSTAVQATVIDDAGEPLADFPVRFATTLGVFSNDEGSVVVTSDENGMAATRLHGTPILGSALVTAFANQVESAPSTVRFITGDCQDFEPNDVPNQASQQPSAVCRGSLEDDPEQEDDYYFVEMQPGQTIDVELDSIPNGADYDIALYRLNPDPVEGGLVFVAFSTNFNAESEAFTYAHPDAEPDIYWLSIYMLRKSPDNFNEYRLKLALDPLESVSNYPAPTLSDIGLTADPEVFADPPRPPKAQP